MTVRIAGLALLGLLGTAPLCSSFAQAPLAAGANSFTEGQARSRIEDAGYADVTGLQKDEQGVWRGRGTRNGAQTEVGLDFQGNVVTGAASRATGSQGNSAINTTRDGTPGNPPGTAADRAADTTTGTTTAPDGTAGNPAGTAASRAVDRAAGTNTSGANPGAAGRDGTAANPPSTFLGRSVDRAQGETPRPDGTPGNPSGTTAGRAVDRALGTNSTGANPGGTTAAPTR